MNFLIGDWQFQVIYHVLNGEAKNREEMRIQKTTTKVFLRYVKSGKLHTLVVQKSDMYMLHTYFLI